MLISTHCVNRITGAAKGGRIDEVGEPAKRNPVVPRERGTNYRTASEKNMRVELTAKKITPCLWFDTQAEEAAKFYASVFKNSKIGKISRYGKEGFEVHGKKAGTVMTVEFEIEGQKFLALNGGPHFKFNEAVSFQVPCETQEEIDYFWSTLAKNGEEGRCGWLK